MIIQRIASALRRQDWAQVTIELLIVIVGIFVGLQVDDWNNDRAERDTERTYLSRLHSEVVQNLNFNTDNFEELLLLEHFQETERYLDEVLDVFAGRDTETMLNDRHCHAIYTSMIYNDQQSYLPTLTELLASGQLSIIQSEEIKISLSEYTLAFNALKQQVMMLLSMVNPPAELFPEMFKLDNRMRDVVRVDQFSHECDFNAMKKSQAFSNILSSNVSKLYYFNLILAQQQQSLQNVHAVLDAELGITHTEDAS